jgi:hypothetical protein
VRLSADRTTQGVPMRTIHRISTLALALGALTSLSGCLVAAAGAGAAGTAYVMGSLDSSLPATPQKVVEATESVLKDTDIRVVSKDATGLDGSVVATTALDTKIQITIKRQDDKNSKISIRVGTFGDRELSEELFEKIKAKLPAA